MSSENIKLKTVPMPNDMASCIAIVYEALGMCPEFTDNSNDELNSAMGWICNELEVDNSPEFFESRGI